MAALVLAAGTSSRYRAEDDSVPTKLVADLGGVPLVRRVVCAALGSRAAPVIVVTGYAEPHVTSALADLDVRFVRNPSFARGLSTSLRVGLAALPANAKGALILLGDMPSVGPVLLDQLISAFESGGGVDGVVPVRDGRRGNPALLAASLFAAAAALEGDEGARRLLRGSRVREIEVSDPAVAADVDDPDMLRRLRSGDV